MFPSKSIYLEYYVPEPPRDQCLTLVKLFAICIMTWSSFLVYIVLSRDNFIISVYSRYHRFFAYC